jgi:hypothetical protein
MGDPVSWYLIRPGWKVVAADGSEIGKVDEVTGDEAHDIFDGLAIAESAFGKPRYIPAEVVAEITDGVVRLSLSAADAGGLEDFREPAAQERIEPSDHGGLGERISADVRGIESWMSPPKRERSVGLWGRIVFALRRLRGR